MVRVHGRPTLFHVVSKINVHPSHFCSHFIFFTPVPNGGRHFWRTTRLDSAPELSR